MNAMNAPGAETWLSGSPAAFHAELERSRIVPVALAVPCAEHGAAVGVYCWSRSARGVCGERLSRARFIKFKEAL